ncbi:MAG: glutamate--tRNA ligase family protein, partial [Myxococcota bacterium]
MGYVGRLAPSPTGRIHVGIARTSLLAWLDARAHHGQLLLRIEDIDRTRCRDDAESEIIRDLQWLGLNWDEAPDGTGPMGSYRQSDRSSFYLTALDQLFAAGRVYPCTCSRKEIALAASAPHGPADEGPRYPETCRAGARPKPGRRPALRLRTDPTDVIAHRDRRLGELGHDVHAIVGDFVIRRSDEHWAYQLAVSIDDALQGVTDV